MSKWTVRLISRTVDICMATAVLVVGLGLIQKHNKDMEYLASLSEWPCMVYMGREIPTVVGATGPRKAIRFDPKGLGYVIGYESESPAEDLNAYGDLLLEAYGYTPAVELNEETGLFSAYNYIYEGTVRVQIRSYLTKRGYEVVMEGLPYR